MDPITLIFYAVVCGCLSVVAPKVTGIPARLGVGAGVGIIAATTLPFVKDMLNGY